MLDLFWTGAGREGRRVNGVWLLTAGEVESRFLGCSDAIINAYIATIHSIDDAVLEARRILQVEVDLTVLAGVRNRNIWAN